MSRLYSRYSFPHQPKKGKKNKRKKNPKSKQKPSACFVLRWNFFLLYEEMFSVTSFLRDWVSGIRWDKQPTNQSVSSSLSSSSSTLSIFCFFFFFCLLNQTTSIEACRAQKKTWTDQWARDCVRSVNSPSELSGGQPGSYFLQQQLSSQKKSLFSQFFLSVLFPGDRC